MERLLEEARSPHNFDEFVLGVAQNLKEVLWEGDGLVAHDDFGVDGREVKTGRDHEVAVDVAHFEQFELVQSQQLQWKLLETLSIAHLKTQKKKKGALLLKLFPSI